jgi:hypothetical protein
MSKQSFFLKKKNNKLLMLFAWPKKTSGEIRGSFRKTTELDTYDRALEVFMN